MMQPIHSVLPRHQSVDIPLIAITAGDPSGIGPEIIAKALSRPDLGNLCRVIVLGDPDRISRAVEICDLELELIEIEDPDEIPNINDRRIRVVRVGPSVADLPWGVLDATAGESAYQAVRKAAELAVRGAVDAICTAPLNKEALHLAGHRYPGHTELLAELCNVSEVSMMLTAPGLRVVHVTTHVGLIDAISLITPGLVERTVRRANDTLLRAGITRPRIAVCGINPHAGENGLFGSGEEEDKIVPAIDLLQRDGLDVVGPLPADTLFFRASRGDFDCVVAMYHDQGHGPIKVLGLEAGVNVTIGLPVVRTSVDHGTAFDIAGTGLADESSLIAALRQAVDLARSAPGT